MDKDRQVELKYCKECKEILFVWDDLNVEIVAQQRFMTPDGFSDYNECETIDSKNESNRCSKGHEGLIDILISYESFKRIYDVQKNSIAITIPEISYYSEISDEDFNLILLESGVANLSKGK